MRKGARLNVLATNAKKVKEFKVKLSKNYSKRIKPKKNNVPNVKSELKIWMRKVEFVKVVKRSMNKHKCSTQQRTILLKLIFFQVTK